MPIVIIKDGSDPLTKPILDYLDAQYGMPAKDIRCVTLTSRFADVQILTVELLVKVPIDLG